MSYPSFKKVLAALLLTPWLALVPALYVNAQQTPPPVDTINPAPPAGSEPIVNPQISSRPPGLQFDQVQRRGGSLVNSQLAQYITSMYRYGVGIVAIVAVIMTVYGGFRYLVGSSMGDIAAGKKIIQDAIAGMLIVLGAYLILQTVNPATLGFAPISLKLVSQEGVEAAQESTQEDTTEGVESAGGPGGCPIPDLPPGHIDNPFQCGRAGHPVCTDHALRMNRDPRAIAFEQRIGNYIRVTNPRERILAVADAAAKCGVHMESCGHTAGAIWRIAGMHPAPGGHVFESSALVREGAHIFCSSACGPPIEGCVNTKAEAVQHIRDVVRAQQDARANLLEPGDWFWIYNANASCGGNHSMIFVRWEGNRARVIQGAWGKNVSSGTVCLKVACGNFQPIDRIMRTREAKALPRLNPAR